MYQPSNSLLTGFTGERFVNIKSEELYIVYITIITLLPASAGGLIVYKCNEFIIKKGILIYLSLSTAIGNVRKSRHISQ